ncbi:Zn-dependent oxidoreductase, partial [Klebsiella pneumoniae]|nr:Zn-dependent oxidoreductase [Klebsiella pneumoniae]
QLHPSAHYIALVFGAGPMGLTIIQALKGVFVVKQVIVVDRIAERLQMARENGADMTLDNTDQPLAEQLAQRQLAPTL